MKNIQFFVCLLFIAFTFRAQAQTSANQTLQDTLKIKLQGRNQVFYTGNSLEFLANYNRGDSLKALFFADLEKTLAAGTFSELPKRMHYFVNQQGKRRLKAELNEENAAKFDLAYEKNRMAMDLPPLHYTIYDLPKNVEIHLFMEDSLAFEPVATSQLSQAIKVLHKDRKKLTGLSSYRLDQSGFGFERRTQKLKRYLTVEVIGNFGAMVLGNQLSPLMNFDFYLTLPIPSNTVNFRLGASSDIFLLANFQEGRFGNINPGNSWQGSFQISVDKQANNWFGFSVGQLSTENPTGLPKHALKWGLVSTFGNNTIEYSNVNVDKDHNLIMVTYKRNIFSTK